MKNIFALLCGVTLLNASAAQAQLVLNAGDVYTYSFNTLPHIFSDTSPNRFGWLDAGIFTVFGSSLNPSQFRMEIFEGSVNAAPIVSHDFPGLNSVEAVAAGLAWRDLQGAVRLTVNSGTLFITSARVQVNIWGPSSTEGYGALAPVPEPSAFLLLSLALLALVAWKRKTGAQPARTNTCAAPKR